MKATTFYAEFDGQTFSRTSKSFDFKFAAVGYQNGQPKVWGFSSTEKGADAIGRRETTVPARLIQGRKRTAQPVQGREFVKVVPVTTTKPAEGTMVKASTGNAKNAKKVVSTKPAPKKATKPTVSQLEKVAKGCICECGKVSKKLFVQGHDAKFRSQLVKLDKGEEAVALTKRQKAVLDSFYNGRYAHLA